MLVAGCGHASTLNKIRENSLTTVETPSAIPFFLVKTRDTEEIIIVVYERTVSLPS